MYAWLKLSILSRLAAAVAALWLCGAGPAWAGGEGASVGAFQAFLGPADGSNGFCKLLAMTTCPQVPTLTQVAVQISALVNSPPDLVRSPLGPGPEGSGGLSICTPAGNQNLGLPVCSQTNAINAINPPAPSLIAPSELANLVPLAFIGPTNGPGQALPVPLGTIGADSFFYAVTTEGSGQPDTLSVAYDYPPLTNTRFLKNQQVAAISLPLVLRNSDGTEQPVMTTLQISAACTGGTACLTATASGNFTGNGTQKRSPGDLGVQWALVFEASPNSSLSHAIFQVQAPLVVTGPANATKCGAALASNPPILDPVDCGNDPAYFGVVPSGGTDAATGSPTGFNQVSGSPTAFATSEFGFPTAFLKGVTDGIAPSAAPPTVTGAATTSFGFCASFLADGASGLQPAVATFAAIGTDGTTYVSSPIPPLKPPPVLQCPF